MGGTTTFLVPHGATITVTATLNAAFVNPVAGVIIYYNFSIAGQTVANMSSSAASKSISWTFDGSTTTYSLTGGTQNPGATVYEAQIGNTKYQTLEAACAAVSGGSTITILVSSITLESYVTPAAATTIYAASGGTTINGCGFAPGAGRALTLSGKFTFNGNDCSDALIKMSSGGQSATISANSTSITVNDGYAVYVGGGASFTMSAGSITTNCDNCINNNGGTVNISGTSTLSGADITAIRNNGGTVNIYGNSRVEATNDNAIYNNGTL